jgi:SAM-dependent methyltransferase
VVDSEYDKYVRAEWEMFSVETSLWAGCSEMLPPFRLGRVLDVGCGAGQELLPFVKGGEVLGIGVDISPEVGWAGAELMLKEHPEARVSFARAAAESLPFPLDMFRCSALPRGAALYEQ